jgi:hypothetical protein
MPRYTPGGVTHKNSGTGPTRGVNGVRLVLQSIDKLLFGFRFVESVNGVAYCPNFGRAGMTVAVKMFFENTPQIRDNGFLIGRGLLHGSFLSMQLCGKFLGFFDVVLCGLQAFRNARGPVINTRIRTSSFGIIQCLFGTLYVIRDLIENCQHTQMVTSTLRNVNV